MCNPISSFVKHITNRLVKMVTERD